MVRDLEGDVVGRPARWYSVGRDVRIVVDPRFGSVIPTIEKRGATIHTIHRRFKLAHHSMDFVARDLDLEKSLVEEAIRYTDQVAA